jgi:hypothetical protein
MKGISRSGFIYKSGPLNPVSFEVYIVVLKSLWYIFSLSRGSKVKISA